MHFAGLKAVGESVDQPLRYYRVNLTGSINLLEVSYRDDVPDDLWMCLSSFVDLCCFVSLMQLVVSVTNMLACFVLLSRTSHKSCVDLFCLLTPTVISKTHNRIQLWSAMDGLTGCCVVSVCVCMPWLFFLFACVFVCVHSHVS